MDFVNAHGQQTEFLGRSDYIGQYHSESYGLDSAIKQAERERVLEFILSYNCKEIDCVKLLSFPGLDWTFERMVLAERNRSQFVGIEHSYSAFMRSRRAIPGVNVATANEKRKLNGRLRWYAGTSKSHAQLSDRQFRFGRGDYIYSRRSSRDSGGPSVRANRLLYMKADDYMTLLHSNLGATMEEKKSFNTKFYSRTAVWLDFTSQFCKSVQTCLEYLPFCLESNGEAKPVVITMMNARDNVTGVEARLERIQACQPAFQYERHWTYTGKNGTSMLTVCGSIV